MKTKKIFGMGMVLVMAILTASTALAFGVSSPYWEGNPLTVYPGETKIAQLGYQNMGEDVEDLTVRAEITKGSEIASLSQQDYVVASNTRDTQVEITVSVLESAEIGTEYKVTLTSRTVTPGTEGGVGLGVGMDTTFDVLVVEKSAVQEALAEEVPEAGNILLFVLLAVIILALILLVVIKSRKKGRKNK